MTHDPPRYNPNEGAIGNSILRVVKASSTVVLLADPRTTSTARETIFRIWCSRKLCPVRVYDSIDDQLEAMGSIA